jgi:DNA invertase Pin-like site-specific DNA recombinase
MGKAVLLVRVSTDRQSFDEQERQLFDMAIADGYSEDNIILIAEKESGRKLKEEERKGLNRLKEVIQTEHVDVTYCWEISRIARKKKILFSVLDYLIERKIQLIIKEPYLKLLNTDGSINESAETTFTLFAQMAESEMRNKDARFKRAKAKMKETHQYRGGWLPLGYKVENGYIVIDEDKAAIIRLIFNLYTTGVSSYKMSKELQSRGIEMRLPAIRHILANENYCNGLYPVIISKEIWNKKCETAKANDKAVDKSRDNIYFAAKLIKCDCGRCYTAFSSTATYLCVGKYQQSNCTNTKGISINAMDSLLWWIAKKEYAIFLASKSQETKQKLIDELAIWNQKLGALDGLYSKIETKLDNLTFLLGNADITKETYISRKAKVMTEKLEIDNNKVNYQNEIDRINNILSSEYATNEDGSFKSMVDNYIIPMLATKDELLIELDNLSDQRKYDIIHQYINWIQITHIDTSNKLIIVNLNNCIGLEKELEFTYKSRGKRNDAFKLYGEELEGFKYIERVKPKHQQPYEQRIAYYKEYNKQKRRV